ncbi:hypothetical protein [Sinimarinibacterium thermocellulolyticum]|uniref:Uncharacterized protein n=1 Tax=Sinimarinibacterium thermocellulolyticum TaxID=3170016 RepID=A0ABV2ABN1_9GAMM
MLPTDRYAVVLFGSAAIFNAAVAAALLCARPQLAAAFGLDPIDGSDVVVANLAGALVGLFGYAYLRLALDPLRYRVYAELGAIGKLLAVAAADVPWLQGVIDWRLPLLAAGDLLFALLFIDWLRRTRSRTVT